MAVAVEDDPMETELEIEAILNAMEQASPGSRAEYIGGSFTLNRPRLLHQRAQIRLGAALQSAVPSHLEVLPEPRVRSGDVWIVPDLVVVPVAVVDQNPKLLDPADIVLLVEIVSPSTEAKDRGPKRDFCQHHRIDHWLVEPGTAGGNTPWGKIEVFQFGTGAVTPPTPR